MCSTAVIHPGSPSPFASSREVGALPGPLQLSTSHPGPSSHPAPGLQRALKDPDGSSLAQALGQRPQGAAREGATLPLVPRRGGGAVGPCGQLPMGTFLPESASWTSGRVRCRPLCFFSMTPSPRLPSFSRPLEGKRGPGPSDEGGLARRMRVPPARPALGLRVQAHEQSPSRWTINNVLAVLLPPPQPPIPRPLLSLESRLWLPCPSRAFCPCSLSAWLPAPQMLRVRLSLSGQKPPPTPGHGEACLHLLLSQCLAEGQAQSRY